MRNALLYLLAARVLRVQQHKEVRVYSLTDNWLVKLKKLTEPYQHNNYKAVDSVKVEDVSTEAGGENG